MSSYLDVVKSFIRKNIKKYNHQSNHQSNPQSNLNYNQNKTYFKPQSLKTISLFAVKNYYNDAELNEYFSDKNFIEKYFNNELNQYKKLKELIDYLENIIRIEHCQYLIYGGFIRDKLAGIMPKEMNVFVFTNEGMLKLINMINLKYDITIISDNTENLNELHNLKKIIYKRICVKSKDLNEDNNVSFFLNLVIKFQFKIICGCYYNFGCYCCRWYTYDSISEHLRTVQSIYNREDFDVNSLIQDNWNRYRIREGH